MIDLALNHSEELKEKMRDTWYNDKYKYLSFQSYCEEQSVAEDSWQRHEFVSLDKYGRVIGYIAYTVDRVSWNAHGLEIVNFSENRFLFGHDVMVCLRDIFEKFNFHKLSFKVATDNPIMKTYDKLCEKYGGEVVGIHKEDFMSYDHRYHNIKEYEILRHDYLSTKTNKEINKEVQHSMKLSDYLPNPNKMNKLRNKHKINLMSDLKKH